MNRQQNINTKDGKSKYRIRLHDKNYQGPGAPIAIAKVQAELDVSILQNSFLIKPESSRSFSFTNYS